MSDGDDDRMMMQETALSAGPSLAGGGEDAYMSVCSPIYLSVSPLVVTVGRKERGRDRPCKQRQQQQRQQQQHDTHPRIKCTYIDTYIRTRTTLPRPSGVAGAPVLCNAYLPAPARTGRAARSSEVRRWMVARRRKRNRKAKWSDPRLPSGPLLPLLPLLLLVLCRFVLVCSASSELAGKAASLL
jgi:hypothetical protein